MSLGLLLAFAGAARAAVLSAPAPRLDPPAAPVLAAAAPLDLSPAAGGYERRGVGLLVVDVVDSTPLHLSEGNRRAHAVVAAALEYAQASAALFDGVVIRRLGDGQLIAFPRHQDAQDAAQAIQNGLPAWRRRVGAPPLALRAGVHAGRVIVDASGPRPEIYGQAVERVLRLASAGRGGEIAREDAAGRPRLEAPDRRPPVEPPPGLQPALAVVRLTRAATLFASLADWTSTYERYGRRFAYATVKAFHEHARRIVEAHGGLFVKTEGETVMASFASAKDAVRAGTELQARLGELRAAAPLGALADARVGISYGRVLRRDELEGPDFFGNTVNAAARLMRRARPGEVLVSGSALADAGSEEALRKARRETMPLKGFVEPIEVRRLRPEPAPLDPAGAARLRAVVQDAMARLKRLPGALTARRDGGAD